MEAPKMPSILTLSFIHLELGKNHPFSLKLSPRALDYTFLVKIIEILNKVSLSILTNIRTEQFLY